MRYVWELRQTECDQMPNFHRKGMSPVSGDDATRRWESAALVIDTRAKAAFVDDEERSAGHLVQDSRQLLSPLWVFGGGSGV